jgi:hypothetical protein
MMEITDLAKAYTKLQETYRRQMLLGREHNEMGRRFREGEISESEWRKYKERDFKPENKKLGAISAKIRSDLAQNSIYPLQNTRMTRKVEYPPQVKSDHGRFHYLLTLARKADAEGVDSDLAEEIAGEIWRLRVKFRNTPLPEEDVDG